MLVRWKQEEKGDEDFLIYRYEEESYNEKLKKYLEEKIEKLKNEEDPMKRLEMKYMELYYNPLYEKIIERPMKKKYYLEIAKIVARRSTCLNVRIGAVIVREDQIIATGYVGAPRKTLSSIERATCLRRELGIKSGERYELCRSVHAEQNAIINAARAGVSLLNGEMYIYGERYTKEGIKLIKAYPCFICKKMIINAGIGKVIINDDEGNILSYDVKNWVEEWKEHDLIGKEQYNAKYDE